MRQLGSIERLRALWLGETSPASWQACGALAAAGLVATILVGRMGFDWSRALAAALLLLALTPTLLRGSVVRRQKRDARALMAATLGRTEPQLAGKAMRALTLSEQTDADPKRGSSSLAQLHLARVLGRMSFDSLGKMASKTAWRATMAAVVLAAATLGAVLLDPFRLVEGADVIVARDGVAPLAIQWIELPRVSAEPPSYLQLARRPVRPYFPTALHVGTQITVHAIARYDGRQLVLSDGQAEVPFRDDGGGSLVAHYDVERSASLRVAARFGDVLIEEPRSLELDAIADRKPHVKLDGAPATHRLLDTPRIAIHWEAIDDHGLREVALVLHAGEKEERRELSKPQGGNYVDRGGIDLRAEDPFLKNSYLPVEVTVEALDNDPVTGPKWGRSESMVLVPPQVGEREAMRYRALRAGRDAMTDLLASRIESGPPSLADRASFFERQRDAQHEVVRQLIEVARQDFGGLRMRGSLATLVRGQLERLDKELARGASGAPDGYDKLLGRTETALLAIDSALGAMGAHDTRMSAIKLSDVATDTAAAIELGRDPAEKARADRRMDADLSVLEGGGKHLVELGSLGRDLGEIIANGLRRIRRALSADDRFHARLAAEDLAARLRVPDPSFGSSGDGHGHGGVEGGGTPRPGEGDASSAAKDAAGVEQALEQLRQEHAAEMDAVRRSMEESMSPEDRAQLEQQLREQAKAVREAVSQLPQQASDPASSRAQAAQARSQAEAMAGALERGELGEAAQHGQRAMDSLQRAQRTGGAAPEGSDEQAVGQAAGDARDKLSRELEKAQRMLKEQSKQASQRAGEQLKRSAKRERELAERARQIREKSASSDAPLPREMLERLEEAARAMDGAAGELDATKGRQGMEKQREAQRLLELSQPESDEEGEQGKRDGNGRDFARDADVPPEARDAAADEFRKRVTEGFGHRAPPHLREAIRRYSEGLLR